MEDIENAKVTLDLVKLARNPADILVNKAEKQEIMDMIRKTREDSI